MVDQVDRRIRDKTVCTRIGHDEVYILNLLASRCGVSKSSILRVALALLAKYTVLNGNLVGSRAVRAAENLWAEASTILESCRSRGLRVEELLAAGEAGNSI